MALSDLELLELVERAQDERQGPIGPQGVGIRSIEQPTADTVIIALTDGRTKELRLTAGPKGDPGEAGKPGQDGKPGPAGSPGRAGAAGVGVAGAPGRDGTSIDTAIVNADGNLLLGLTDGNVLNVGRVVGPPGATGAAGPTGLPGRAGRDGNTILSGPHAPADNEGNPGDFWIDTSSALFDFYGKGGQGWRKLTSLRAPQTPVGGQMTPAAGGGGGSGGGSGGGELQNTRTLPLINPTAFRNAIPQELPDPGTLLTQEDANKYLIRAVNHAMVTVGDLPPEFPTEGELWWSTQGDELTLFIRIGDDWVPASPPVSLDGIEASVTGLQEYLDVHITPALAGATGDIRTLEAETAKLNAPNVFNKSNIFRDKDDQQLFVIQEGGVGGQNSPKVQYYGMVVDDYDIVNKVSMDRAIDQVAGNSNAAKLDEDNVFSENNEFLKPVKVAEGGSSSHATTNAQLGRQKVELDNSINNLQGQVDVLDGRVDANGDALGDLEQKNTDQDAQIDDNKQKIDALSRTAASGVWRNQTQGDTTKAEDGEFTLWKNNFALPVRDWTEAKGMTIAEEDQGGINHDITAWQEGDHVEMFEENGTSFAIYEVGPSIGGRPGQVPFGKCLRHSGNPLDRIKYRFRVFDGSTGIDFNEADDRYVNADGDKMTGQLAICLSNNSNAIYLPNNVKADQVSTIRIDRPYSGNGGVNSDGTTSPNGRGGLNFDIAGASDQNRVRFRGGQGLNRTLLDITGVNNWKNIKAYSAIGLYGGDDKDTTQAIYASSGNAGHLCYSGISTSNQRLSWGTSKVWIKNSTLDLTQNKIIHVADPVDPEDAVNLQTMQRFTAPHPGLALQWKFSTSMDEEPQPGRFSIVNKFMYIHPVPNDSPCGTDFVQLCHTDRGAHDCRTILTVYTVDDQTGKYTIQTTYQVYRIRYGYTKSMGSPPTIQVEFDDTAAVYSPSNSRDYFITIGGLF